MEVTLPSGRVVEIEKRDADNIVVKWEEKGTVHKLCVRKGISKEELDEICERYLYGYDDPETGEHVPGYFELIEQRKEEEEVLVS